MVVMDEEAYLSHYGILRRSGRYPWGSGGNQNTINRSFLQITDDLRKQGMTDPEICTAFGIGSIDREGNFRPSTTQLRAARTIARNEQKAEQIATALRLKDKGMSNVAAATQMGIPESTFRSLIKDDAQEKNAILTGTADMLKRQVDEKQFVDVGVGVENYLGISQTKLGAAVAILKEQGYVVHSIPVPQIGTGKDTQVKVLAPPKTTWGDVKRNQSQIQSVTEFSEDGGRSFNKIHDALAVDPKRVSVRYANEGGKDADGVIFVREGKDDISLGGARYAQVRVQVGENHYLKGMAMYKDDLPPGVDLVFNTNKDSTGNKLDAMKKISDNDPSLPFGAVIRRQILADQGTPNERAKSAMNIVNEQGDWTDWSKNLSTQFLSKQSPSLAKAQLDKAQGRREKDLAEIMALTNPTVKKSLLDNFAEDTDSAAVHLEAAALSRRQAWHVILPVDSMPPTQVYAPNYKDGERLVLVRYPHGGTFEIPELTVNNRNREAKRLLGDAPDAIGIHKSVAERLSGADFDGDTVVVIPNNSGKVKITPALEKLKDFDPQRAYPKYDGMPVMSGATKQHEMGNVSNLITDMTIRGASHDEIAKAVRHSMVVIDAEKHELNYKQSYIDNGIAKLKEQYQGGSRRGASTLISRATSEKRVDQRKPRPQSQGGPVDRLTGEKVFVPTNRLNQKGTPRQEKSEKLRETNDARTLVSDANTPIERHYASYSNNLKSMANKARLESLKTPPLKYSPSAKKIYSSEVASLNSKLALAERNAPRERQAQIIGNATIRAKRDTNPNLEGDTLKKIRFQALEEARIRTGAKKDIIIIEDNEWNAIQAGAISNSKLEKILKNADIDRVRELATPRSSLKMSGSKTLRARAMLASGATRSEVAAALGVSISTLDSSLNSEGAYE